MWKGFNIFFFIYIAVVTYSTCFAYGVDFSIYLRPILIIPGWLIFLVAMILQYILQNLQNNEPLSIAEVKKDFNAFIGHLSPSHPLKLYGKYLWLSFKVVLLRTLLFIVLMIPVSLILSVIMSAIELFTGAATNSTVTFYCSWSK